MLHNFLANNCADLIARCIEKVSKRPRRAATKQQLTNGIPMFIDQLIRTLQAEQEGQVGAGSVISGPSGGAGSALSEMGASATAHGKELLKLGYSVDQVVHDYGDLCQAITDLAFERDAPFSVDEFRILNRCLDNAIADAVTEFSAEREAMLAQKHSIHVNEQIGFLMHELRNPLGTASMAVSAMDVGNMTLAGATGSVLKRSLASMARLITQSLDEVRTKGGGTALHTKHSLALLIADAKEAAELDARRLGCTFTVAEVDPLLAVHGNRELLLGALMNLLQNAFKFTHKKSEVLLAAYARGERILIDVQDHCGGLPVGNVEKMFTPFTQRSEDKTGLGLGLTIARRSVEEDGGILSVRNLPGEGCIFTIDLPCYSLGPIDVYKESSRQAPAMSIRLAAFIAQNKESILQDWEDFASTIEPAAQTMDSQALRDHASLMLDTIVHDMEKAQSPQEQSQKSKGLASQSNAASAAQSHAADRLEAGYTIHQLLSEYRALRASVVRLWSKNSPTLLLSDSDDMIRFNEAVDQSLAESVLRYSQLLEAESYQQKRIEDELRQSNQQKDEFLAMLAHELRNPLAPISTAAQLLSLSPGNESVVRQASEIMNRQILHLTKIVDDLLDVSRVTRGLVEMHTEPLDLKLVISNAIEQAQPLIEKRGHALVLHLDPKPALVEGDKTRLVQVLSNLLSNAAKYTPHNGEIVLALQVSQDQACLAVSDNGSGIAPSLLSHIFELFTQAERTLDRAEGGLGLGLSLVKNIIDLHEGKVEAKSEGLGRGSVFRITLPLVKKQVGIDTDTDCVSDTDRAKPEASGLTQVRSIKEGFIPQASPSQADPSPLTPEALPSNDKLRVMLVDDSQDVLETMSKLLRLYEFDVLAIAYPLEALERAAAFNADVYLLDIGMPIMNGYELVKKLRQLDANHARFIALTGYGRKAEKDRALAAGFDVHLAKPVNIELLIESISAVEVIHRI